MTPQTILFVFGDTERFQLIQEQARLFFENISLENVNILGTHTSKKSERRASKNLEDPSNKFLKIVNVGPTSSKNMKWTFGNLN